MQLNVELPESELIRIKQDAIAMGTTLQEYARQSFKNFLSKPVAARRIYFEKSKKLTGRKIKA
jgi:hypothetical protein